MSSTRITSCLLLLAAGMVLFAALHERHLSGYDPASFVLALKYGYSTVQERPHAPGYPGFFLLWKGIETVTTWSPHSIILVSNLLFSLIAVLGTYLVGRRLFNERTALIAALLVLTNPLLLYYGNTAELYAYDAAFSIFLIVLLLVPLSRRMEIGLYVLYGLLGSFRLSSFILTAPVVLAALCLLYYRNKQLAPVLQNAVGVVVGMVAWLVPYVLYLGSVSAFVALFREATYLPTTLPQNLSTFLPFMFWMLNLLGILVIVSWKQIWSHRRQLDTRHAVFLLLIIVPASFFALKYYAKGYGLLYVAPVALLGARLIVHSTSWKRWTLGAIVVNLLIFFAVPFITPSVRSTLSKSHRTTRERWETSVSRALSSYAPTLAHLQANERGMEAVGPLLLPLKSGSVVLVDLSASGWAYPRSLQVYFPTLVFLMPVQGDSSSFRWFRAGLTGYDIGLTQIPDTASLYDLTTGANSREILAPPGALVAKNAPFELYSIPRENFGRVQRILDSLYRH